MPIFPPDDGFDDEEDGYNDEENEDHNDDGEGSVDDQDVWTEYTLHLPADAVRYEQEAQRRLEQYAKTGHHWLLVQVDAFVEIAEEIRAWWRDRLN